MSNKFTRETDFSDKKKLLLRRLLQKEAGMRISQGRSESRPVLLPRRDRVSFPLSCIQMQIWTREQLVPAEPLLSLLGLNGPLDLARFRQSWQMLLQRHEILRAVFANVDGTPVQSILPPPAFGFSLVDLSRSAKDAANHALTHELASQASRHFDLEHGPLYSGTLIQYAPAEQMFLLAVHPLLADQTTLLLLCHELAVLYSQQPTIGNASLPELALSYADYASWQQQQLPGSARKEYEDFWKRQLANLPLSLDLPLDHPRTSFKTQQASSLQTVDPALVQQARTFCDREGVPIAHLLFTLFSLLLNRYTGQSEMLLGFLSANRPPELEALAGPFAMSLFIHVRTSETMTGQQFLHRVHQTLLDAERHQTFPLTPVVEALYPELDLTRTPFVQASFAFDQLPSFSGLSAQILPCNTAHSLQDISCTFQSSTEQLQLMITCNSDLFEPASIERFHQHYCQLLHSFISQPGQTLATFSCLTPAEQTQVLYAWNTATLPEPIAPTLCIQQLFEQQAERTPQAIALSDGQRRLSYQELNDQANQLAHLLVQAGVGPEQIVGLCLDRSLELVIGLLAILKAGAAYLPLDPTYPSERLAFTIQDAQPALILTRQHLLKHMPFATEQTLCLDTPGLYAEESTDNLTLEMNNDHLAYVIYTSGSTGRPKGVCICHRSAVIFLHWARQHFSEQELASVLAGTSLCFDLSIFELLAPLSQGGKAVIVSSVLDLPQVAESEQITLVNTVPSAASALLDAHALRFSSLLTINLAGEALTRELVQALYTQTSVQRVNNLYGPTEDTTYSTWTPVAVNELGPVSIGHPLVNTSAYIVDARMQPVPVGVAGELYLGGDGQARGYLKRPDLTATRFVPDPFSQLPGQRLYKTGDLARYRADGSIDYLGRLDQQVKIRGFRIELGEIEAWLRHDPAVADAVVVATENTAGEMQLVAYVVARPQQKCEPTLLRQHLQRLVPAYMLPTFFITLERLPLTPNGKVDRNALPAPHALPAQLNSPVHDLPQGQREQRLSLLWQEILQLPAIGRTDNFFLSGGDSLLAMRLLTRLQRDFRVSLTLEDIFTHPTLAQLAARLQLLPVQPELEPILPGHNRRSSAETPLPLSFAQQRLWFVDQLEYGTAMHNVPLVLALTGPLKRLALYQALREIICRHAPLRTTIQLIHGNPVQFISDLPTPAMTYVNLALSAEMLARMSEEELYAYPPILAEMQKEVARPFDLASGPLLRVRLLHIQQDRHILLLTMHHTITDGWSLTILAEELGLLYNAFLAGHPSPLPALPIQYSDYIIWQRERQTAHFAEELTYWKNLFTPPPPPLSLPIDYPRPAVQTFTGESLHFQLSTSLSQQLLVLSRQEGVTLFMTLLAAFLVLLARYSGEEALVVGTTVANRPRPELETLLGFFANTLALRVDLAHNPTIRELLQRVSRASLEAYRHQDVPFEQVVEAVQPRRDPARSPLFQVHFLLQNLPGTDLKLQDLHVRTLDIAPPASQFDLSFVLEEHSAGLHLTIEYNTQLFAPATIGRFQSHYQALLAAFCTQLDSHIQQIPLLGAEEQRNLLDNWRTDEEISPTSVCLHALFEAQVERTPTAIAVQDGERTVSYQELNWHANQLAHALRQRGIGPDRLVGLCLDRSIEQMVGLLAILKAGGAYVPLDPLLPAERLDYMLADARIRVVLTRQDYLVRLNGPARELLCVDSSAAFTGDQHLRPPVSGVTPLNLAYVIYTSGSTGRPKGVLITHHNAINHSTAIAQHYQFAPSDRVLQFSSLSFDAAVEEIFPTWLSGARLRLRPAELPSSFEQFQAWLEEQQISVVDLPTAYWHVWAQEVAGHALTLPTCLRLVIIGGEKAELEHWKHWLTQTGNSVRLSNTYGPTEATVTATFYDVPTRITAEYSAGTLPIGKPLPNVQAYVLDEWLQLVPVGVPGELYLSGAGIARGYLGRPDFTAERFMPDPWSEQPGQRMYRTGDRVYRRADGQLVYIQRQDQQVKVRGFRIEPGEIEHALRAQSGIHEAVVLLREDQPGLPQLVAYVQPDTNQSVDVALLRQALKKQLPTYMLPAAIMVLETLPLTLSGKIDRRHLPPPDRQHLAESPASDPPQGPLEKALASIWQKILKGAEVGRTDNFFEIGGHSLLAMQVLSAIREELQVTISIRQFFTAPTIGELATIIELEPGAIQEREKKRTLAAPPLVRIARTGEYPLSFAQQRLWFLDQLESGSATYTIPAVLQLTGDLNLSVFQLCMREIVRRHEVLRTTFPAGHTTPVQCIQMLPLAPVEVVDIPAGWEQEMIAQAIQAEVQRPFDLARGPLLRIRVLRLSQREHILIFTMHHIISDGWSMSILAQELNILYHAFIAGKSSPLPELAVQYVDFVAWQRSYLQGERLEAQLAYWKQQLSGAPPLKLPTDHPRTNSYAAPGADYAVQWPQSFANQVLTFSQQENVTLFMTMLTGLLMLLAYESGQEDIVIGTPVANRAHPALEELVGLFVNTVALRTSLAGNPTGHELLQRVRNVTLESYDHQDIPFEQVVETVHVQRQPGVSPLFQVLFVLQNNSIVDVSLPDVEVKSLEIHTATAKFDLSIGAGINAEGLGLGMEYNTQLFERSTIESLQIKYRLLLEALMTHPAYTLAAFYEVLLDFRHQRENDVL